MLLRSFLIVNLLLLTACSSVSVTRVGGTADDLTGFDNYRWGWSPLQAAGRHDADLLLQDQTVRRAVLAQMSPMGFSLMPFDGTSELVLDYQLQFMPEQYADFDQPQGGWVWRRDGDGELQRNRVEAGATVTVDRLILQLTIYSSNRETILWSASGSRLIDHDHKPKQMRRAITQIVEKLFKTVSKRRALTGV